MPFNSSTAKSFSCLKGGVKKHQLCVPVDVHQLGLATKAVQGAALALEGVDNVKGRYSLAASVLSVGHRVTHNILQEYLL